MSDAYESKGEEVATKVWDTHLFGRLLHYARPHKMLFAQCFLVLASLFALQLVGPWVWRNAIDGPVTLAEAAPEGTDKAPYVGTLMIWIGVYLLTLLGVTILRYFEVATLNRTGQAVVHDLRVRLFKHLQHMDLGFFDSRPTGSLVTRVTSDVENLSEMFTSGVVVLAFDILKVAVLVIYLFTIHPTLALVVLCLLPLLIGISLAFRGGARRAHRSVRARLSELNGYLQEVLQGIRVVQVFRREERVSGIFREHLAEYFRANKRTIFLFALFFPAMSLAVYVIQGSALWVGVRAIVGGGLTYGLFFQFWLLLNMLVRPIRELGERYNVLQSAFASAERIFQVLDTEATVAEPSAPTSLPQSEHPPHVRFEQVGFSYLPGKPVVKDISFEIPPGQTVALVGATGAGKSTLINLLLRFYDPSHGQITFEGTDIADLRAQDLRGHLGLVLQEDFLFTGSVRENLVMARPAVDEPALQEALASSSAKRLIERLPDGLESKVAERGATFSTGERQLLAIARALAGRPDVVILDEATASVDSATEAAIERATEKLLAGRSALVVAHRLSTIRGADQILVMDGGRIIERGTHAELMDLSGQYARLYALQFADEPSA
ncbi:MAG: ATP-binding cassette subfamily B multidrug efflux pump [Planctomycetota bacterium]|jgi:ATP-binding cassette subfamily B multidrug efflux pump